MFDFWKKKAPASPIDFLVVGLGNPGEKYCNTRHNAGFMAVELLAENCGVKIDRLKFKALTAQAVLDGRRVLLMKPGTFMNLSGQSVTEAMQFYKLPPEKVLVLFDDISLPVGKLRVRRKGSDGGHNGMKNILYLSGSDLFPRVKIGVGERPDPRWDLADWVLSRFTPEEMKTLLPVLRDAGAAAGLIVNGRIDDAMAKYN